MAAGLPTIASPVGANHQYIEISNAGLLARDKEEWVEKITTLVKDGRLRAQMARDADRFVKQFDRTVLVEKLFSIISNCVSES